MGDGKDIEQSFSYVKKVDLTPFLLLPQVATEYCWDRTQFLEHTSLKACLPADGWKDGADVYIFEAEVFGEEGRDA